ncbi:MAG TPA: lipopolysaccharide biosynthesis protein [Solirubrobacteraceae bacterium]|nr:lipopolysaccharide biosynthesis protein [Solirubrobacteraceae bacterium]
MLGYLRRLVTTGAAYQFGDILAKALALITLPLYTHHLSPNAYGVAESLLTAVILSSIVLRAGVGEAFIRFYFDDEDGERKARIARTATATVAWSTSLAAVLALVFAGPLSKLIVGFRDPLLLDCAVLGLWAFTNLEVAYAQLRVDERSRAYIYASGANVALTVSFTVALVVFAGEGARGLLLGNFAASALVVLGLWWGLRGRVSLRVRPTDLRAMLAFGLPTVPADASVYALQVVDRFYLYRSYSHGAAGLYAVAIKLATVVFVAVRGFQYAWPPLAYSIEDDEEAGRLYSLVTTYYVLATGAVVCGVALLGRWLVRLLSAHQYFGAHRALPWLALGWALYGLYLVFLAIAGRARVTRRNLPAAALGLLVNVVLLVVLVPASGAGLGIAGAGLALCGAYLAMLGAMYALTRRLFPVGFEWVRLAKLVAILGGVAVSGELLLPDHGAAGLALRAAWLALVPAGLLATRFVHAHEREHARRLWADGRARVAAFRAGHGDVEAYAEDPLRDV